MTETEARDRPVQPSRLRSDAAARARMAPGATVSSRVAGVSVATLYRHLPTREDLPVAAGAVRPDVTVADLIQILAANAGVTATGRPAGRPDRSRRLADLALTGLRVLGLAQRAEQTVGDVDQMRAFVGEHYLPTGRRARM